MGGAGGTMDMSRRANAFANLPGNIKAADAPEPGAMALVDVSRTCYNALVEGAAP